jgi:hypothetical protein
MRSSWKLLSRALAAGTILGLAYHMWLRPRHLHWGMTAEELDRDWPGDELVPNAVSDQTHAITINAPPSAIWPWIVQIGQDRAGFYSYTALENLFGCEMCNADRIVPEWQQRQVGEMLWMTPKRKYRGIGRMEVAVLDPNRAMILISPNDVPPPLRLNGGARSTWAFILEPIDEHSTRFVMRARSEAVPQFRQRLASYAFWEPAHFLMERKMMLSIKERAERTT